MESYIYLDNITLYAYHGVSPQETKVGNSYVIHLRLKTNIQTAIDTDEIADTINYAEVYQKVFEEMAIPSKLLEHVCGRIIRRIFRDFPTIEAIDLKLSKQNPPMGADITAAGIEIHCDRKNI